MKASAVFIVASILLAAAICGQAEGAPVPHKFVIRDFATESGAILPQARVMYGTCGRLNPAGDNAVLLPSHYMADTHGYDWLIGPGKALDPRKLFLVTSELFGHGRSSSLSNTHGLARLALFTGMVASRAVARREPARHDADPGDRPRC